MSKFWGAITKHNINSCHLLRIYPVPGPGLGAEIAGEMTQGWPFRETWEEGAQEDGENRLGELAPY